ncbi:MAG TPA: hypothetical protein VHZ50_02065 [Puia sp.]|jgi:hypothetical protein|nr:hypothetical protein [Puia sp.]
MKKLFGILIYSVAFAAISCNNSSATQEKTPVSASTSSSNSSQNEYGKFTFAMNGKQRTFTAWHEFILFPMNDKTKILLLVDGGPGGAGFDFRINKEGATEFKSGYVNMIAPALHFSFFDTTGISYIGDGMVVNVASLNTNRLTGTFSGKFVKNKYQIKEDGSANAPQIIEVTDGKFDLHK